MNTVKADRHVIMPHQPDWSQRPMAERVWRTGIDQALAGMEARAGVRQAAWRKLTLRFLPHNHIERARLEERVQEGMKLGLLAIPEVGVGAGLIDGADAGDEFVWLQRDDHGIADGDYIVLVNPYSALFDQWDLTVCVGVSGRKLTLPQPLDYSYPAGTRVWPFLFGRPEIGAWQFLNLGRSSVDVSVTNDGRSILPSAYDNFESYTAGDIGVDELDGAEGWAGAWEFGEMASPMLLGYDGATEGGEDSCRSYFTLTWDYLEDGAPGMVQCALLTSGTWHDYIEPQPTPADDAAGVMSISINNQFAATRKFRAVSTVDATRTSAVTPLASRVPMPEVEITNLNAGRGLVAISSIDEIYTPYSELENTFVSNSAIYVEPIARYEWEITIPVQSQIVSVTNEPAGGSWKWTRNGADPTVDTFLPRYESLDNNLSCGREDFAMVAKVRCFDGACKSPVAVIAIDKRFDLIGNFVTSGVGGTITASCDIPRTDSFPTWQNGELVYLTWTSGNDCDEAHNGVLTYTSNLYTEAASLSGGISSDRNIYTRIKSNVETASGEWPHINIAATNWNAVKIDQVYRNSYWDLIPKVCEYLEQDSTENGAAVFSLLATPSTSGNAGVGGTLTAAETASMAFIASRTAGSELGTDTYSQWDYLLSIINEFGEVTAAFAPDIPAEADVYGDDFEEYSNASTIATDTLDAGTGWSAAWQINESSVEDGYDFFLDYGDVAFDYNGGLGWSGDWEVNSGTSYKDDFSDYTDGVVNGENGILNGGTGWATSSGFQVGWFGTTIEPGIDDCEDYEDSADIAATTLAGGTGWGDIGGWVVNE